jgi:hypothetical protein
MQEDGDLRGWTRVDVLPPDGMQEVTSLSPAGFPGNRRALGCGILISCLVPPDVRGGFRCGGRGVRAVVSLGPASSTRGSGWRAGHPDDAGMLHGARAVVDKDLTTALLACSVDADVLC